MLAMHLLPQLCYRYNADLTCQDVSLSTVCMQIEGLSALVKLEELTIRHNRILRQVLLRPFVCFCLPTLQVCWAFGLHQCAVCMLSVHLCQVLPCKYMLGQPTSMEQYDHPFIYGLLWV